MAKTFIICFLKAIRFAVTKTRNVVTVSTMPWSLSCRRIDVPLFSVLRLKYLIACDINCPVPQILFIDHYRDDKVLFVSMHTIYYLFFIILQKTERGTLKSIFHKSMMKFCFEERTAKQHTLSELWNPR
jgi:hypothetical protein